MFFYSQLRSELRREWLIWYSYRFNALSSLIMWGVIFPVLLLILQNVVNTTESGQFGVREQTASLIGFLVWHLCMRVLAAMPEMMAEEARTGTLESIVVASQLNVTGLLLLRVLARSTRSVLETVLLGVVLVWLFSLSLDLSLTAVVVVILTMVGTWGAGFILLGLALLYKSVGSVAGLVANLAFLLSGAFVPINGLGWLFTLLKFIFPTTWGIDLLRQTMLEGISSVGELLGLMTQTLLLLGIGVFVFRWMLQVAKERGVLGSY